jgi:hypothetical protein
LGYVRVPTWLPCRLQVYFNGHSWLANLLRQRNIGFRLIDNAFVEIADWQRAQHIADGLQIKRLHRRLDEMAHRFCPIHRDFGSPTTGAWTSANTPPTWGSVSRRISRRSTAT